MKPDTKYVVMKRDEKGHVYIVEVESAGELVTHLKAMFTHTQHELISVINCCPKMGQ